MRCRYCDSDARVLSTRQRGGEFYIVRRHECLANPKHRFNTVEIPEGALTKLGSKSRIQQLLATISRGTEARRRSSERSKKALALIAGGMKYEAVADEVGVSLGSIRKYVKAAAAGPLPIGRVKKSAIAQPLQQQPEQRWPEPRR